MHLAGGIAMSDAEFRAWLQQEVGDGRMTVYQKDDLLNQKQHFDADREEIQRSFQHLVVGYVSGTRQVDATVDKLLLNARKIFPDRMVYFEPVGFDLL